MRKFYTGNVTPLANTIFVFSSNPEGRHGAGAANVARNQFDKVLARDYIDEKWILSIFSCYEDEDKDFPYVCLNDRYRYCIPYEGNEHLLNTPNTPKDY